MSKIQYKLIRSARKTLCISILNGEVIVRSPMRTPLSKIEEFVDKKSNWILKKLSESNRFDELRNYNYILLKGNKVPLVLGSQNRIDEQGVTIKNLSNIKKLYIESFGKEFLELFNTVSQTSGLKAKSVSFKSYRARWGCCNTKKQIIFNWKLLMLSSELWECVIVHELCHTVYMNHSKNFHQLANSVMPAYALTHKQLKKYSSVTRLY
ncbi:MAG: M48 family metallopeptidase [Candidatus Coproplasma sp.]